MAKTAKPVQSAFAVANTDPTLIQRLFSGLYEKDNVDSFMKGFSSADASAKKAMGDIINTAKGSPLGGKALVDGYSDTGFGTTGKLLKNWIGDHKVKSAAIGGLGLANVAGLFDNPNIVGQLAGGALGGLAVPKLLARAGAPVSTSTALLTGLTGGGIGSLFDKLMAKKAEEQQYRGQY